MSKLTLVETDFFNICSVKKLLVKNHADLSIVGFSCEFFRQGAISFSQCLQENSFLESVFIKTTQFSILHTILRTTMTKKLPQQIHPLGSR